MRRKNLSEIVILFISLCGLLLCLSIKNAHSQYLTIPKCTNCSPVQTKFIAESVVKVNETIFSSCFIGFMMERDLIQTNERSNPEVLESIMFAQVVVDAEMYYTFKRVLGYTLPDKNKIWINRKYMMKWNRCDLASLLGHESSHKIGYGHSFYATKDRMNSVPYSMNEAFKKCCVR